MSVLTGETTRTGVAFESVGPAVIRTPAFCAEVLRALYAAPDLKAALYALLREDPRVVATIELATPSLHHGVSRWLSRAPDADEGAAASALAYVARSATRSTPLAACAAVGSVPVERGGETALACSSELERRTRPDSAWLFAIVDALERNVAALPGIRVMPSGLTYMKNGRLEVADVARAYMHVSGRSVAPTAIPTALNPTRAVTAVLELAAGGATVEDLAARGAARLGVAPGDVLPLIAKLVEIGVLLTELRVPLTGDPAGALEAILTRTDDPARAGLAEFRALLSGTDRLPLLEAPAALSAAAPRAAQLAQTEHLWQIDARRETAGSIGGETIARAERTLAALYRISPRRSLNRRIATAFMDRYNAGREVPLLELLDVGDGLPFEKAVESVPNDAVRETYLLGLASKAIAAGQAAVELSTEDLDALAAPDEMVEPARGYEAICHLVRDAGGATVPVLAGGAREGTSKSLARFHDLLAASERAPFDDDDPDVVSADFVALPHSRRAANVAVRRGAYAYEVVCGLASSVDREHTITLDDIVVGVRGGRVYLRSLRLGKHLRVEQPHMLNPSASSRFAKFFSWIGMSDVPVLHFEWGSLAAQLPFRPRVTIEGVVVQFASWLVPRAVALDLGTPDAAAWRATWRLPRHVYLSTGDNRLLLDLEHPLCRMHVAKAAAKQPAFGKVGLEEALPFFGDETATDECGGRYFAEAALSFRTLREREAAAAVRADETPVPHTVALRAPGSDWTYLKLYIAGERASFFLEREILPLFRSVRAAADDAYFIRYADPEPHVRLRLRARAGERETVLLRCLDLANRWVESGLLARVALDTYDREVERYGGVACIALAERCFSEDSALVLDALAPLRIAPDRDLLLLVDTAEALLAVHGGLADAYGWLRRTLGRRGHIKPEIWKRIRLARAQVEREPVRMARFADAARTLFAAVPDGRRDDVARALFHMHANRMGINLAEERRLLACAQALFDGMVATASPP